MEMARLDDAGGGEIMERKIRELEIKIEKTEKTVKTGNSKILKIMIPMLGLLILVCALNVGVLSGYLLKYPHQQTAESGPVNVSKPGKPNSRIRIFYCIFDEMYGNLQQKKPESGRKC